MNYKKLLILVGVPLIICIFVGLFVLGTPFWFLYLDYTNPVIQYYLSHIGLCLVGMSACMKLIIDNFNKWGR